MMIGRKITEAEHSVGFVTRYGTAYQMEFQQAVKLVAKSWESLEKLWEA